MSKERAAQLIDAGIWLRLSGDLEGARKLFERALKLDPANERAAQLLQEGPVQPEASQAPAQADPFEPPVAPPVAPVSEPVSSSSAVTVHEMPAAMTAEEVDWGKATGFDSPAPFRAPSPKPSNPDDWGSMLEPPTMPNPVADAPVSSSSTVSLNTPELPPVRSTPPIFGSSSISRGPALTVSLDGNAPPPSPIRATPPQFTEPAPEPAPLRPPPPQAMPVESPMDWRPPSFVGPPSGVTPMTVTLTDANAPAPSPPRSTPPLFDPSAPLPETHAPFPTAAPSPPLLPPFTAPPAAVPTNVDVPLSAAPDPVGVAWAWSSNSPAPFRDPATAPAVVPADDRLPVPLPSPLSPNATSAWDARSNPGIALSALVGEAKALEMLSSDSAVRKVAPPDAKDEVKTLLRGARDLLDLDDHTGAMELIVKAQSLAPDDPDVKSLRERSEKTLLTMFESKIGKLETVPRVLLKEDEIIWLNLDHRAGFVLAQIDGTVSFDDLFAVSGMSRLDTARILAQLVDEGVINRG